MSAHVRDRLSAYLDGELSVVEAGEVRQHLAGCEVCAAELLELQAVDRAVRELPVDAPASYFETFAARVRSRIEAGATARPRGGGGLPRWAWAVAAALLLAVLLPRLPWDRPATRPQAEAPAAADSYAAAPAPTAAPPATSPPAAAITGGEGTTAPARGRSPARAQEARADLIEKEAKKDEIAPPAPEPSPRGYAEPPHEAPVRQAAPASPETAGRRRNHPQALSAELALRDEAEAAAPAEGEPPSARPKEELQKKSEPALRPQAAVASAAAPGKPEAAPREEGKLGRTGAGAPAPAATPAEGTLRALEALPALTLEEQRAQRETWRRFVRAHPEDSRVDEARVRVIELGALIARQTAKREDLAELRTDATAYLAREDARQKERVRALLVPFEP